MAASTLSEAGLAVTVYDRMPTAGRKFLMAGRGGLNLTHSEPPEKFMARYGDGSPWLASAIQAFPPDALRRWCEGLGQKTFVGSSGRVFPQGLKASPLLRVWLRRLDQQGVRFAMRHRWRGWDEQGRLIFTDGEERPLSVKADATLLALGGASWPRLGSDGAWADDLRKQGIAVSPLQPANCGVIAPWSAVFGERFAGHPLKPAVFSFGTTSLQGEAIVTRQGLEGSAIYALSSALRQAIAIQGQAVLSLDLRPGLSLVDMTARLQTPRGSQSASNYLRKVTGLSPVAIGLMRESLSAGALPVDAAALAALIKQTKITLTSASPITRAISSAGGIARDEIDAHFMLKKKPGLFVAGEMCDWEAPTGGYLLQACFSTAVAAAQGIRNYLLES